MEFSEPGQPELVGFSLAPNRGTFLANEVRCSIACRLLEQNDKMVGPEKCAEIDELLI